MRRHLLLVCALGACTDWQTSQTSHPAGADTSADFGSLDDVDVQGGELRFVGGPRGADRAIGFPLQHTTVTAKLAGAIAVSEIEQDFANPYDEPLEAVYAFPLGAHGAISGYAITVGGRTIDGRIQRSEDAQRIYDDAVARGHTAAIVKQVHPNLFTQRVANIAPHQTVRVHLTFVESLAYDRGQFAYVLPLTIGPRYKPDAGANPGYVEAARAGSTVGFTAEIVAGTPIASIESPTHELTQRALGPGRAWIALADRAEIPNRDLVVRFATGAADQTTAGLASHRQGTGDGFFVLSVAPKLAPTPDDISGREVMLVIDHSGSMMGEPIAQAKEVGQAILATLGPRDTFDIVAFSGAVDELAKRPLPATAENVQRGGAYLRAMSAGGGTEMGAGVAAMLDFPPAGDRVRIIYFLTDGDVGNDDVIVGAASAHVGTNRIFTVGVGSAPNRSLLDKLAAAGRGYATYLAPGESTGAAARDLVARSTAPLVTDVTIDWGELAPDIAGQTPAAVPDVYAGKPLVISAAYHRPARGTVTIRGRSRGLPFALPLAIDLPEASDFPPAEALFARRQIEALEGDADANREKITAFGLTFHVVTQFTSFVAVDQQYRVASGLPPRTVEQPSVLPADVEAAHASSHDSGGGGGGGGGFHWGSGGPDDDLPVWPLAILLLGAPAWLVVRRSV